MQMEAPSPAILVLATASAQRPRTNNARLRPVSARIAPHARASGGEEPSGPRFPTEAVVAWVLAGTAVFLAALISGM